MAARETEIQRRRPDEQARAAKRYRKLAVGLAVLFSVLATARLTWYPTIKPERDAKIYADWATEQKVLALDVAKTERTRAETARQAEAAARVRAEVDRKRAEVAKQAAIVAQQKAETARQAELAASTQSNIWLVIGTAVMSTT